MIPDKLFFTIGEVSEITGIKPYILRYWETEFKSLKPQKNTGGQRRLYRQKDIKLILYIKQLLYEEKYTIIGAKKKLKDEKGVQLELFQDDPKAATLLKLKTQLKSLLDYLNAQ